MFIIVKDGIIDSNFYTTLTAVMKATGIHRNTLARHITEHGYYEKAGIKVQELSKVKFKRK